MTGASDELFFSGLVFPAGEWNVAVPASIAFVIPQRQLVRGKPPNTPFERMEVFMEGLFFAIGFLLGSVAGVLIMCLLQINRIGKKEDSEE